MGNWPHGFSTLILNIRAVALALPLRHSLPLALAFLLAGLWPGTSAPVPAGEVKPKAGAHQPNAYRLDDRLPPQCRRVAVLPLACNASEPDAEEGARTLEPVLHTELAKCALFELVFISPEELRHWTGKTAWAAEEKLPVDLLGRVRAASGCDAVLFARLAHYRPYGPLQVGFNLKLVDAADPRVIYWAADQVYDAGQPAVARQAKGFYHHQAYAGRPLRDNRTILMSPRWFGQFALSSILATLPSRDGGLRISKNAR